MPEGDPNTRRSRRRPLPGVLVQIETREEVSRRWVVDAVDLSADGMGLVLPEELAAGTPVLLSLRLDGESALAAVPAIVQHREPGVGGMHFEPWDDDDRLVLLEYLVRRYESD